MSKNEQEFNQQVYETIKLNNEILRLQQEELKQFRILNNDIASDWFYCKDFTIEAMQHLAERLNKFGDWNIEYKGV